MVQKQFCMTYTWECNRHSYKNICNNGLYCAPVCVCVVKRGGGRVLNYKQVNIAKYCAIKLYFQIPINILINPLISSCSSTNWHFVYVGQINYWFLYICYLFSCPVTFSVLYKTTRPYTTTFFPLRPFLVHSINIIMISYQNRIKYTLEFIVTWNMFYCSYKLYFYLLLFTRINILRKVIACWRSGWRGSILLPDRALERHLGLLAVGITRQFPIAFHTASE